MIVIWLYKSLKLAFYLFEYFRLFSLNIFPGYVLVFFFFFNQIYYFSLKYYIKHLTSMVFPEIR